MSESKHTPDADSWEANAEYLLARCPHTVRQRPGGGPEDIKSSLVVTFMGMQQDLAAERRKVEALRSASVDSRGWLVEWRYHGSVQWLYLWAVAGGGFSFTADASKALRLARREDAEAVLEWARDTDSRRGLHSSTFLVTEHVWESAALASTEGGA